MDGLKLVVEAKLCPEFLDILYFDGDLAIFEAEMVFGVIDGQIKACLYVLQVDFFLVFDEKREIAGEIALDDAPETARKVSFPAACLIVVLYLTVLSRVVERIDLKHHIFLLLTKLVQILVLGYTNIPFRT